MSEREQFERNLAGANADIIERLLARIAELEAQLCEGPLSERVGGNRKSGSRALSQGDAGAPPSTRSESGLASHTRKLEAQLAQAERERDKVEALRTAALEVEEKFSMRLPDPDATEAILHYERGVALMHLMAALRALADQGASDA